jgi:integrase/recombinase XerD
MQRCVELVDRAANLVSMTCAILRQLHRLTAWYREGKDVQLLLPQLSVYLGHTHLAATQVYLTMTPELLREASLRFELYARGEGHHD